MNARPNSDLKPRMVAAISLLAASLVGTLVAYATRWGPWAYSDGVGYLTIARNLTTGIGLGLVKPSGEFELLVSHPPLYPLVLAALDALGLELLSAARWIDMLSAAALAGATTIHLRRRGHSLPPSGIGGMLLVLTPAVFLQYVSAMAEPLFLLFAFSSLYLLSEHLASDQIRMLVWSGLAAGLALLTRYPGVAFAIACWLSIAWRPASTWADRLRKIGLHAGLSLLPVGTFLLLAGVLSRGGSPKGISSASAESLIVYLRKTARVFWEWKPIPTETVLSLHWPELPAAGFQLALGLAMALSLLVLLIGSIHWRHRVSERSGGGSSWIRTLFLFMGTYYLLYAFAFLLTDPTPDVDARTLLPLLPAALLLLYQLTALVVEASGQRRAMSVAALVLWTSVALGFAPTTYDMITGFHRTGGGYTSPAWRDSETIGRVRQLPADRLLVSNHPEAVLLHTGRYPHDTEPMLTTDGIFDDSCRQELGKFVRREEAALVLFREGLAVVGDERWHGYWSRVERACDLELWIETEDGAMFLSPDDPLLQSIGSE